MLNIFAKRSASAAAAFRIARPAVRLYSNKPTPNSPALSYGADPIIKYTPNHEWIIAHKDNVAFVGITKYAADALGDTTFVEVNDPPADVESGESLGSVESVKSASDVYSPVNGQLIERNEEVINDPSLLNKDPMGEAWLAKVKINDVADLEELLTLEQYKDSLEDH